MTIKESLRIYKKYSFSQSKFKVVSLWTGGHRSTTRLRRNFNVVKNTKIYFHLKEGIKIVSRFFEIEIIPPLDSLIQMFFSRTNCFRFRFVSMYMYCFLKNTFNRKKMLMRKRDLKNRAQGP